MNSSEALRELLAALAERHPAGSPLHQRLVRLLPDSRGPEDFCRRAGLPPAQIRELEVEGRICLARAAEAGLEALSWFDEDYPAILRSIPDPPLLLFLRGRRELFQRPALGIVGARRVSSASREIAGRFGAELSAAGIVVVSGMAMGVDRAAHEGALSVAEGNAIAVLGAGADVVYPKECRELHHRLGERALILSEYAPGTQAHSRFFPVRNRIIAGLSQALIVIQAALRSGSLITARLALEYGRDVFAVPGDIRLAGHAGSNRLLLEGAIPALDTEQVRLWAGMGPTASPAAPAVDREPIHDTMAPQARCVLRLLERESLTIDELVERTGMDAAPLNALLIRLEAAGWVRQEPGRRLVRTR